MIYNFRMAAWGDSVAFCSSIGSLLVGLTGVLPILFLEKNNKYTESIWIKYVLAFGAGTLLGDAFLHLLPEVMNFREWPFGVLAGYLFGFVFQKFSPEEDSAKSGAYVNLFANCLDNFTHGLAIGGSFVIGINRGWATTATILVHEIPHEFGDFAILLRGGLTRSRAALLQSITAFAGLSGALFVIFLKDISPDLVLRCIVPFTIGAFIYVSLTNVLPELMEDEKNYHWIVLIISIGIVTMGLLSSL